MTSRSSSNGLQTCVACGTAFEARSARARFCSNSCRQANHRSRVARDVQLLEVELEPRLKAALLVDGELVLHLAGFDPETNTLDVRLKPKISAD